VFLGNMKGACTSILVVSDHGPVLGITSVSGSGHGNSNQVLSVVDGGASYFGAKWDPMVLFMNILCL